MYTQKQQHKKNKAKKIGSDLANNSNGKLDVKRGWGRDVAATAHVRGLRKSPLSCLKFLPQSGFRFY